MSTEHDWFRTRFGAHLLGVLPDEDAPRFLDHASECVACGDLLTRLERVDTDWWEGTEHLSVPMLGAHLRQPPALSPSDRLLVEAHLSTCESCRTDLAELRGSLHPRVLAVADGASRRRLMPGWLLGGLVGSLATAAVFVLILQRPPAPPPATQSPREVALPVPSMSPPGDARSADPARQSGPADRIALMPAMAPQVLLRGANRGTAAETTLIRVATGTLVPLRPPQITAPAARVRVSVRHERGEVVVEREMSGERLVQSGVIIDAAGIGAGVHVLRIEWTAADGASDQREYPFRIELRP